MVENSPGPDCGKIRRVEGEEVDSRLAAVGHLGTHVQLGKARKSGQRWDVTRAYAALPERYHANPALIVEAVNRELGRNERPKNRGSQRPVGKPEIVPDLNHDPRAGGNRPGTMSCRVEQRVHDPELSAACSDAVELGSTRQVPRLSPQLLIAYPQSRRVRCEHLCPKLRMS